MLGGESRNPVAKGIILAPGVDKETAREIQIVHASLETGGVARGWGRVQFDFKGNLFAAKIDEQIDFMTL